MSAVLETARRAGTVERQKHEMVHAEWNYLVPMPERAYRYEEVPPGAVETNMHYEAHSVAIENARLAPMLSLDREGFQFETHESAVRDFFDSDEVTRVYDAEVEALL